MKINNLFSGFVKSGGLLAASAGGNVIANMMIFGLNFNILPAVATFFITFSVYHINHRAEVSQDMISHPERALFIKRNSWLDIVAALFFLAALAITFQKDFISFLVILVPIVSVIVYTFKSHHKVKRVKDVKYLKNIFVAVIWSVNMIFTAVYFEYPINWLVLSMEFFLFLRFFVNTVFFDLRDMVADKMNNVDTIPVKMGENLTKNVLKQINIFSGVFLIAMVLLKIAPTFCLGLLLTVPYGHIYLSRYDDPKANRHFLCDVVADGEFLLWPIFLLIGIIIFKT